MSRVAQNGYIYKREIDTKTGRTDVAKERVELGQMANQFDSMSRAQKTRRTHELGASKKIPLPPSKKSAKKGTTDTYDKLAAAFGAISVAMGRAMSGQANVFSQEQEENTNMAKAMLIAQHNQMTKEQQVDATIKTERDAEAAEQHASKIAKDFEWAFLGLSILVSVIVPAVGVCVASITSAASLAGTDMMIATASCSADAEAFSSTAAVVEATEAEVAQPALVLNEFAPEAEVEGVDEAAAGGSDAATTVTNASASSAQESTTKEWLTWIGKNAFKIAVAAGMGSDSLVQGIYDVSLSKINRELADQQGELGDLMAETTRTRADYTASQMQLKRDSSVIESMGQQSGEVVSTFADMMRTVREASNSIAYAA